MSNVDSALAKGIDAAIKSARERASEHGQTSYFTNRDVARRMSEAGRAMDHPAVQRARTGQRAVSAREWLTFAVVLSVPPLALLDESEPVDFAGSVRPVAGVKRWALGLAPLPGVAVDRAEYFRAGSIPDAGVGSFFGRLLRSLADEADHAASDEERQIVAEEVVSAALAQMRNARAVRAVSGRRRTRVMAGMERPGRGR